MVLLNPPDVTPLPVSHGDKRVSGDFGRETRSF
jgi:hypothetical protein